MPNGCNWQEKSFSVAVSENKTKCSDCGDYDDLYIKYNGDWLCHKCVGKIPSKGFSADTKFFTTKDQLYDFVDFNTTGKPLRFSSKRQWNKHLKSKGLTDDIKQSYKEGDGQPHKQEDIKISADDIHSDLKASGFFEKLRRDRLRREH